MKIEVGEYVRTIEGIITKIVGIDEFIEDDGTTFYETEENPGYTDLISKDISKHSKNIIDLIEVGDYVNGKKIEYILEPSIKIEYVAEKILCFETDYPIEKGLRYYHNCDIKSIVTHEQFASVEYKVEEDK